MKQEHLELRVGMFVLAGLLVGGFLVVSFGRFGELFERNYRVVVEFEDARGIIKNAKVLYRGAKVGKVKEAPRYDAAAGGRVELLLEIGSLVKLDKESVFRINSYGLLGDQFVDVAPPKDLTGEYLQDGDRVLGSKNVGLTEIAASIEPLVKKLESFVGDLDSGGGGEGHRLGGEAGQHGAGADGQLHGGGGVGEGPVVHGDEG
jgi:phospholipid/cholesterol/gamma-HCH transport system substrate-binding protein